MSGASHPSYQFYGCVTRVLYGNSVGGSKGRSIFTRSLTGGGVTRDSSTCEAPCKYIPYFIVIVCSIDICPARTYTATKEIRRGVTIVDNDREYCYRHSGP